jgi:hypothetical protein
MIWQKAWAQRTQGGASQPHSLAGRPWFGANEITLSTRVMLSRKKRIQGGKVSAATKLGHPRWLAGWPNKWPPGTTFTQSIDLIPPINTPLEHGSSAGICLASIVLPKFSSSRVEIETSF